MYIDCFYNCENSMDLCTCVCIYLSVYVCMYIYAYTRNVLCLKTWNTYVLYKPSILGVELYKRCTNDGLNIGY